MIFNMVGGLSGGGTSKDHVPVLGEDFTYSGSCTVIDDSNDAEGVQWRIKFFTSGSLVVTNDWRVDLFLVGGGRSGSGGAPNYSRIGGNGGDGGQCKTIPSLPITKGVSYPIVIGGSDGDTSALEQNTSGGGASGGNGGASDGSSGNNGSAGGNGSSGTYEFGEAGSDIYGGGGGGGGGGVVRSGGAAGKGGSGGSGGGASGGNGGVYNNNGQGRGADGQSAAANTGGGGGGGGGGGAASSASSHTNYGGSGGTGGSGIVIMRKHKGVAA